MDNINSDCANKENENSDFTVEVRKPHWLTDFIGNQYELWKPRDIIILESDTGTGKSTFVLNTLIEYASKTNKKVLFLLPMIAKIEELKVDIKQKLEPELHDFIKVITYQKLEHDIEKGSTSEYEQYDYIFADESHYFTSNVAIPDSTPYLSLDWIMKQNKTIRIFASATGDDLFVRLKEKYKNGNIRAYSVDKSYDYITDIFFFKGNQLCDIINNVLQKEIDSKILVFIDKDELMAEMYERYGLEIADYLCSKNSRSTLLKRVCNLRNNETVQINKRILFATSAIKEAISIKDRELKHIICTLPEFESIVQCLGRKRSLDQDDICTFYVEEKTVWDFKAKVNLILRHINQYNEYASCLEWFLNAHKDDTTLVKNGSVFEYSPEKGLHVNRILLDNYDRFYHFYLDVKEYGYKETFRRYVGDKLKDKISDFYIKDEDEKFLKSLQEFEGKHLYKSDQNELKQLFLDDMKRFNYIPKSCGLKVINRWLNDNYRDYEHRLRSYVDCIRTIDGKQNPNHKRAYWYLE